MKATRLAVTATVSALALLVAACGGAAEEPTATGPGYPVTVTNCGAEVTFRSAPERVVLLKSAAVPYLHALGVLDRVTARAGQYPKEYYDAETLAALERIPLLTDKLGSRPFASLSGGERQRVLIARALAQQATHLLLDEPTNHLDIRYQHEILRLVRDLGTCAVVVLHDLNLAARYCDDLVLLGRGGVAAAGTTDEVLDPAVLEPVYGIGIQRLDLDGAIHLLYHPVRQPVPERSAA